MNVKHLYVYILKCSDGVYYTGVTNNPQRRLSEHNTGRNKHAFTYDRRPVEMVYCEAFTDFKFAICWEKKIKDWSRKKKEALINENWDELKKAAACKNDSHCRFSTTLEATVELNEVSVRSSEAEDSEVDSQFERSREQTDQPHI